MTWMIHQIWLRIPPIILYQDSVVITRRDLQSYQSHCEIRFQLNHSTRRSYSLDIVTVNCLSNDPKQRLLGQIINQMAGTLSQLL